MLLVVTEPDSGKISYFRAVQMQCAEECAIRVRKPTVKAELKPKSEVPDGMTV